ncbi:hypothetical protein NQ176_g7944 [Zarea fungicola]|uniref:Uncharacterized protein n=1 Tax=Zarea fungicola TaxID=93591 RepID=A0ACC1MWF9_9HYPO|nr:hypothetical protein NQ176_g7944 [Lecanicillium fungicola]
MRGTRSSKAASADALKPKEALASKSKYSVTTKTGHASRIFIIPRKATADARIVTLPHPQNGQPSRYLACPETGIYEFTKVAAPRSSPRSWLLASTSIEEENQNSIDGAETTSSADLYVASHVDPLFILLPALVDAKVAKSSTEQKRLFLSSDDYFDRLPEDSSHLSEIIRWPKTRALLESRMAAICDTVDAGDESMFRVNETKLFSTIFSKANRLSTGGLPASVEERFVLKALEAPMKLRISNSLVGPVAEVIGATSEDTESVSTPKTESAESQSSTVTEILSAISQPSTATSSFSEEAPIDDAFTSAMTASPEIIQLQRLRVAFDFICASYIPLAIADRLKQSLADTTICKKDFSPLTTYKAELEKLRKEINATRPVDNFSRKRMRDEEEDEARLEKKRKLEEEKKRKATESRGVRDLKKVNTTGMKKLSSFFTKK